MLGKTAGGLYWMQRYLERSENLARLVDAGFRIALTRSEAADDEWKSVLSAAGQRKAFDKAYDSYDGQNVINFMLRDKTNPNSVICAIDAARNNARLARTALTREVWEAINESWMTLRDILRTQISDIELPDVLSTIRQQSALVRGTMDGTMMRNDIYAFTRIGTMVERADSTARILDVKYYVLLPSLSHVGSDLDNVQWETILRSVSAYRAFRWMNPDDVSSSKVANFLILEDFMPRSLSYCSQELADNLSKIVRLYGEEQPSKALACSLRDDLSNARIETIMDEGLHEFIQDIIKRVADLGRQIEEDYRFIG